MTFEETLQALHGMVGDEINVGIAPTGVDPPVEVVALSGELRRVEAAPSQQILEQLGRATPDDEAFAVHVGGSDEPRDKSYFMLRKSHHRGARWSDGIFA